MNQIPLCLTSTLVLLSASLSATTLIYDGYNYGGSNVDLLSTTLPTSATGLTGNYTNGGNAAGMDSANNTFRYDASVNLTFGGNFLPSVGGSIYTSAYSTPNSSHALNASIDITGASYSGTLYSSYLINVSTLLSDSIMANRIADPGRANARLQGAIEDTELATAYDSTRVLATGSVSSGTTYVIVSEFTNVGIAGGGTATSYIFDQTAYDAWYNANGNAGNLGSFALFTATEVSSTTASLADGNIIDFTNFSPNSSGFGLNNRVYFDEMRYGTQLGDVVGVNVPEPSTYAILLGVASMALVIRRRR